MTRLMILAFVVCLLMLVLAPTLNTNQLGFIDHKTAVGWIGIGVMVGGLGLRLWVSYVSTMWITAQPQLVRDGPYRILRHPRYTGVILLWVGAGMTTANWIVPLINAAVMFGVYYFRIQSEEAMLLAEFGEQYQAYRVHTWRLVPFVF